MRLAYVTIPLSLVFAGAGLALMVAAKRPAPVSNEWKVLAQPRHPVTPEMWKHADEARGVDAPSFQLFSTDGSSLSLKDLTKNGPVFIYFVLQGCPCSIEAEPHFEALEQQFHGKVSFLAVTNAGAEDAKKWKTEFAVPYSVASQPKLDLMHLYGVSRSVYSLLIGQDGKIIRMWPGYSASMLQELNKEMAQAVGRQPKKFDPKLAPEIMTSGCEFEPKPV